MLNALIDFYTLDINTGIFFHLATFDLLFGSMMGWKCFLLVLACASACQGKELDRSVKETADVLKNYDVKDVKAILARNARSNVEDVNIEPYSDYLRTIEAMDAAINRFLDDPTSKPPINDVLRHRIALAYAIHAATSFFNPDVWIYSYYYPAIDKDYQQGLSEPLEALHEIKVLQTSVRVYIQPVADIIHELCGVSKSAIEACDVLVSMAIQMDPGKYEVPAKAIVDLAKAYEKLKELGPDIKAATDSFTELAYLIHERDEIIEVILKLSHVYRVVPVPW